MSPVPFAQNSLQLEMHETPSLNSLKSLPCPNITCFHEAYLPIEGDKNNQKKKKSVKNVRWF